MIKNDEGLVGIRNWTSNPTMYTTPSHNVSLGWVAEDDLPKILAIKVRACCGFDRIQFHLANENDIQIWTNGHL